MIPARIRAEVNHSMIGVEVILHAVLISPTVRYWVVASTVRYSCTVPVLLVQSSTVTYCTSTVRYSCAVRYVLEMRNEIIRSIESRAPVMTENEK